MIDSFFAFFFTVLTFVLSGTKSVLCKTAGILAQIKAMTQNCTGSHIFHLHVCAFFKIIILLIFNHLYSLCDAMGRHFSRMNKVSLLLQEKELTTFVANDKI